MSQLTGVIFFTIILLLQGAEELFPFQQEKWKAGADESSLSSHAARFCYLLQRTKMLPTQSIVLYWNATLSISHAFLSCTHVQNHRMMGYLGLEGPSEVPEQAPAQSRSALGSDQAAQGLNCMHLENFQGWRWHNFAGQLCCCWVSSWGIAFPCIHLEHLVLASCYLSPWLNNLTGRAGCVGSPKPCLLQADQALLPWPFLPGEVFQTQPSWGPPLPSLPPVCPFLLGEPQTRQSIWVWSRECWAWGTWSPIPWAWQQCPCASRAPAGEHSSASAPQLPWAQTLMLMAWQEESLHLESTWQPFLTSLKAVRAPHCRGDPWCH